MLFFPFNRVLLHCRWNLLSTLVWLMLKNKKYPIKIGQVFWIQNIGGSFGGCTSLAPRVRSWRCCWLTREDGVLVELRSWVLNPLCQASCVELPASSVLSGSEPPASGRFLGPDPLASGKLFLFIGLDYWNGIIARDYRVGLLKWVIGSGPEPPVSGKFFFFIGLD